MATIYVDTTGDVTAADGLTTLREAIDSANAGDTIQFSVTGPIVLTQGELFINKDLTIDGDTNGDDKADITIDANGASRVMDLRVGDIILDSLTITGGNSAGAGGFGGGIYATSSADVTVQNSTITGNTSGYQGGGIGTGFGTNLTITNSTISNNTAVYGGGLYLRSGDSMTSTTITNTTVYGNAATGGGLSAGGGIVVANGGTYTDLQLINSTVTGNSAANNGGGLYVYGGGTATVTNSIIAGNSAGVAAASDTYSTNAANLNYSGVNIIGGDIFNGNSDAGNTSLASIFQTGVTVDPDGPGGLSSFTAGQLADNGGPVQTVALFASTSNPALDVGNGPATDARGEARFDVPSTDNDPVGMGIADAGAFELQCFAAGTLIATPDGEAQVEALQIGDTVLTADGHAVKVHWIGRHTVYKQSFGERIQPVCIRAGALGRNVPHTDLVLTGDHGVLIDNVVINASALVNGTTINWVPLDELPDQVTYYHVETENHDVIIANGVTAETFIDYIGRRTFDNYEEYLTLYGAERIIQEIPYMRISAQRLVPEHIRSRLGLSGGVTDFDEKISA